MDKLESSVTLNIKINDLELLSAINNIMQEQTISMEDFILLAIDKLAYDVDFVHKLRTLEYKPRD
jgi:hypothetical protein